MMLSRRAVTSLFCSTGFAFVAGCSSTAPTSSYALGQKVQVGQLVYQVLEAQWLTEVPGGRQNPKNRILQLHITITNSGGQEIPLPFLRLVDSGGNSIPEFAEIEGNNRWMGALRRFQPALTEGGLIYFDVPIGAYKLEIIDNTDADNERLAYVDIPASLAPPPVAPTPGG
jgi:hypothetical protein